MYIMGKCCFSVVKKKIIEMKDFLIMDLEKVGVYVCVVDCNFIN